MLWSIGNELVLAARAGAGRLHQRGGQARARSWTRRGRSALAVAGYPSVALPGRAVQAARRASASTTTSAGTRGRAARSSTARSSRATSTRVRACYPDKAIDGHASSAPRPTATARSRRRARGPFQQDFVNYQLGVFATKPWLSGAIYWALNEFWVRPGWEGGNPRPTSPIHQKGLITYDGVRKPAWADVQRWYTTTPAADPAGSATR